MTDRKQDLRRPVESPFASLNDQLVPACLAEYLPFREPTNTRFRVLVPAQRRQKS
jgi:hypothetical protein